MAKSSFNRREFLKISALSSSALALSSCANLDALFLGNKRDLSDEIVILGGGAAGLSAAYALKKRKIPYRLFEASSRMGGRVQSVSIVPDGSVVAEMGAEFFDDTHDSVHTLLEELNLPAIEIKETAGFESHLFKFDGQIYKVKDIAHRMKTLVKPLQSVTQDLYKNQNLSLTYRESQLFERSSYYDSLTLQDLLQTWQNKVDPLILKLIEVQAVSRFGVDANEQSALHFLSTVSSGGSSLLAGRRTFRLEGGLSRLISSLFARVSGVIPNYIVKSEHVLEGMSENKDKFELVFKTAQGHQTYLAKNVICTLPFSKLSQVNGIQEMNFSSLKKEAIMKQSYASHSKGFMSFSDPFWKLKSGKIPANLGNFTGDFYNQKYWDAGRGQSFDKGLLIFQTAGIRGVNPGDISIHEAIKDLESMYPNIAEKKLLNSQIINWGTKPWSRGSMAYFKKGEYMRFKGVSTEPEFNGNFLFAGEHASLDFAGTLNGAIETGFLAASSIARKI